jgi:hypothetical protein
MHSNVEDALLVQTWYSERPTMGKDVLLVKAGAHKKKESQRG